MLFSVQVIGEVRGTMGTETAPFFKVVSDQLAKLVELVGRGCSHALS